MLGGELDKHPPSLNITDVVMRVVIARSLRVTAGVNTRDVGRRVSSADGESHSFRLFDLFNNHKNEQEKFQTTILAS